MAATLKQIAQHSQLSIPTVSEILNNKSNRAFKQETRTRVWDVARQLGYRPNGSARSMRSGRFDAIALLQSALGRRSYLPATLLNSIGQALNERNLQLTLASVTDVQLADQEFIPHILRTLSVDGLLINYNAGFPERLMEVVRRHRVPSIWINSKHGQDCIYPDDISAARMATEYLLSLGHQNIAFVDYNYAFVNDFPVHYSNFDRSQGYGEAMKQGGFAPREIRGDSPVARSERFEFSRRWLTSPSCPSAIITYTLETALPVIMAARSLGLDVPGDLSVITFSDHLCDELGFPVDTMVLPEAEMGNRAVDCLLEKIEDLTRIFPAESVALDFQKGWTTAPPSPKAETGATALKARKRRTPK